MSRTELADEDGAGVGDGSREDGTATRYGETWVYESIVGAIPGLSLSPRVAVAVQLALFEGLLLALAGVYGRWAAVPVGTAAVVVAAAGSYLMLALGDELRRGRTPAAYRQLLFSSSVEVVLGVLAFVALLTYLFAVDPRGGRPPLLADLLGTPLPVPAVYLALLVAWDLCYRIGTGWWASLTGLWRTLRYAGRLDVETRQRLVRADLLTAAFAGVQLLLVPFVRTRPVLAAAVVGHVLAVGLVSGTSVVLLRRAR